MTLIRKILHGVQNITKQVWRRSVELFRFLPIKFKLSLIIGAIVVVVVSAFSLLVLQNQRVVLMARMNQVGQVLLQNLSESVKGDLLLGKDEKVREAVFRLIKTDIAGLQRVAILNHKARAIAAFDHEGKEFVVAERGKWLKTRAFTVQERRERFEYALPIITHLKENNQTKNILLGVAIISFSKQAILSPIRHAQKIALGSAVMIILLSTIVIYVIANKMAAQIRLLSEGARQVSQGNLAINISIKSKDELGQLAEEFNRMTQHLREKMQMQKFVSQFTVDMIKRSGRETAQAGGAVNQNVSVLFSDVRNFSTIAEKLRPDEIVKLINIYFDLQTKIIEMHHGVVDKFMGDQIMAVFQGDDQADNALRAAVEIQRQIKQLNQQRAAGGLMILEMGIGINNGSAVMGNMGSTHRMDYTVIGDVVNVAARLCAIAKAGQIITSYELARDVNGTYPTTRLKSISVKGRTKQIDVCEVDYNQEIII